jgi:phosphoribosylaminoimidazolecarboxamide formyltransferase/IMP cyclohydrolase
MIKSAFFATTDTTDIVLFAQKLIQSGYAISALESNYQLFQASGVQATCVAESALSTTQADLIVANLFGHKTPITLESNSAQSAQVAAFIRIAAQNQIVLTSAHSYLAFFDQSEKFADQSKVNAIRHLAYFDSKLDTFLSASLLGEEVKHLSFGKGETLRYGENAHQSAIFYKEHCNSESSLANAIQHHGKELSYNNIVDADAALEMVREFAGQNAVSIIKHLNPAGLATGETLDEAFEAAWQGDPVSAFGSVIATSAKVDLATAMRLKGRFVEIILAPGYDTDALDYLKTKSKDIRVLEIKNVEKPRAGKVLKHVIGGLLVQDRDIETYEKWDVVTQTPFPANKQALAEFTWIVTKHTKSNAIVMGYEYKSGYYQILGMGPGQPNRIDSNLRLCQPRVRDNVARMPEAEGLDAAGLLALETKIFNEVVMGSDAFFPFSDNIEAAAATGVKFIVSPGGSMRDPEVIAKADELGVSLVFTGTRHFRH